MHSCSWFLWRPLTRYQSGGPWDGIKRLCPSTFYGFLCEFLVERLGLGELLERGFCPPLCTLLPPLFPLLTSLACTLLSHAPSSPFTSSDFSLLLCPLLQALQFPVAAVMATELAAVTPFCGFQVSIGCFFHYSDEIPDKTNLFLEIGSCFIALVSLELTM